MKSVRPGGSVLSAESCKAGCGIKKPRVVRGSERLATRMSELAGLVLAGQ